MTYSGEISYNEAWGIDVFIEEEGIFLDLLFCMECNPSTVV